MALQIPISIYDPEENKILKTVATSTNSLKSIQYVSQEEAMKFQEQITQDRIMERELGPMEEDTLGIIDSTTLSTDLVDKEISIEPMLQESIQQEGGEEFNFSNLTGFDKKTIKKGIFKPAKNIAVNIMFFKDDTFDVVKEKIFLIYKIPVYRQHIFYSTTYDSKKHTLYKIYLGSFPVDTNIQNYSKNVYMRYHNINIEPTIESQKSELRVYAYDNFRNLSNVNHIYVVDLHQFTMKYRESLIEIVDDNFKFNSIYYGFIVKYWPHLHPNLFQMILESTEDPLKDAFPHLSPSFTQTKNKYLLENQIMTDFYKNQPTISKQVRATKNNVAITNMLVSVSPVFRSGSAGLLTNLRNIFDYVALSNNIPIAILYILHKNQPMVFIKKNSMLIKESDNVYIDKFIKRNIKLKLLTFLSYVINVKEPKKPLRKMIFTLYNNGRYTVESNWFEDEKLDFTVINHKITHYLSELIEKINQLSEAAFSQGGKLFTIKKSPISNIKIESLYVFSFIPYSFTNDAFNDFKTEFKQFEKAGIITIKQNQQSGIFVINFIKGIIDYNIDKFYTANDESIANTYMYLFDVNFRQKWLHLFSGRQIIIYKRSSDIKLEFVTVTKVEFDFILSFILNVFIQFVKNNKHNKVSKVKKVSIVENTLKELQEKDTELFDLRRINPESIVYSVLCQHPRAPMMIDESQYRALPEKEKQLCTKYWNFSEKCVVYYKCNHPKFSYLSFLEGKHPMDYCLPCCLKTQALKDTKRDYINQICMTKHTFTEDDYAKVIEKDVIVKHILSYGKKIPKNRLGHIPYDLETSLFFNLVEKIYSFKLLGVQQSNMNLSHAGLFYSLAAIVRETPSDFATGLIELVANLGETYKIMCSGAGILFPTAKELEKAIVDTFISTSPKFTPFSPGGYAFHIWEDLIIELTQMRYNVYIIKFQDKSENLANLNLDSNGDIYIELTNYIISAIQNNNPIDVAMLIQLPDNDIYPIILINHHDFIKNTNMFYQSYFSNYENEFSNINDVKLFELLQDIISKVHVKDEWELSFIQKIFTNDKKYKLNVKLINTYDLCYAVIMENIDTHEYIYVPTIYSSYYIDDIPLKFGYIELNFSYKAHTEFLKYLTEKLNKKYHPYFTPLHHVELNNKIIGFIGEKKLMFYHDPISKTTDEKTFKVNIHPFELNKIIYNHKITNKHERMNIIPKKMLSETRLTLYKMFIYRLFVNEFSNYSKSHMNRDERAKLIKMIKKVDFMNAKSVTEFNDFISTEYDKNDVFLLSGIIQDSIYNKNYINNSSVQKGIITELETSIFNFDNTLLIKLRKLNHKDLIVALTRIMDKVTVTESELNFREVDISNIFVSCNMKTNIHHDQCKGHRLRVPLRWYPKMIEILAGDIKNAFKFYTLTRDSKNIINFFQFMKYPNETIECKLI